MSTNISNLENLSLDGKPSRDFVRLEDYNISSKLSVKQKLSPLDINMPRLYGARWILCFPLSADADKEKVFEVLREGLAHTIASIPWLAGEIGPEEGTPSSNNRIQVVPGANGVKFLFKDLTALLPSYTTLHTSSFPLTHLTTPLISPLSVIQAHQPVFAAQANFISGGLLLTIGIHHSVADAMALGSILETWARNTRSVDEGSKTFSTYDIVANDRSPISKDAASSIGEHPEYILSPSPPGSGTQMMMPEGMTLPPMSMKIFHFSPAKLAGLKAEANAYSTNDALCAFFWHHITASRFPSTNSAEEGEEEKSSICLAVNIRPHINPALPKTYLGNATLACITPRLPTTALTHPTTGLAIAASAIRKAISATTNPSFISSTLGLLSSRPDAQDFKFNVNAFLGLDLTATSWADVGVRERGREWGAGLGRVEEVRVPFEGADGGLCVLPRLRDGGLDVVLAMEGGCMGRLEERVRVGGWCEVWE